MKFLPKSGGNVVIILSDIWNWTNPEQHLVDVETNANNNSNNNNSNNSMIEPSNRTDHNNVNSSQVSRHQGEELSEVLKMLDHPANSSFDDLNMFQ